MDFSRVFFIYSNGWRTDKTYEAEIWAVVEQQYLPKVPVPIQHMAIFYDSVAEPDRDDLKLPIRGYVQANSASRFYSCPFSSLLSASTLETLLPVASSQLSLVGNS